MKKVIICHSFPAWDTPYVKSTIELLKELSADYRVIMIDYHYTLKDLVTNPHAPKRHMMSRKYKVRLMETKYGHIEVLSTPPVLPINWMQSKKLFDHAVQFNSAITGPAIQKALKNMGVEKYTLINAFNPVYGWHMKKYFNPEKTVYYCYDEISATEWSGDHGARYEELFLQHADEVVCTSRKLQSDKKKMNSNTSFVPNGVNLDIFDKTFTKETASKIIGYVGAIDSRIDFDLLRATAEHLPTYTLEMYGPVKTELPSLPQNIHFKGALAQEELPEKINEFEACLIPFKKNKLTAAIYPLKINEYLAMGKAVVSTDFADLSDFSEITAIATNPEEFVTAIRQAQNGAASKAARKAFAQANSWQHRAKQFAAHL